MAVDGPSAPTDEVGKPYPSRRRRLLVAVASVVVAVVLLAGVLPAIADFGEVWDAIRGLSVLEVALLLAMATWNILTYLFVMMAALPRLSMGRAFVVSQMSTAISNTVPAGAVAGVGITYAVLNSFGHDSASIALAAVATGVWNTFVKLGLPVVALALLGITGDTNAALVSASLFGLLALAVAVGLFAVALSSEPLARRVGDGVGGALSAARRLLHRGPVTGWGAGLVGFRRRSIGLLGRRWHWLTVATLVSHVSLFLLLLAALRAMGVTPDQVSWPEALGAFALVRLVTALPITPGGLGLVEVGLTAALVLAGGDESPVVAAVLVYRALTYLLQVPLGALSFVFWRTYPGWRSAGADA